MQYNNDSSNSTQLSPYTAAVVIVVLGKREIIKSASAVRPLPLGTAGCRADQSPAVRECTPRAGNQAIRSSVVGVTWGTNKCKMYLAC